MVQLPCVKTFAELEDRLQIASIYSYDEREDAQSTVCAEFFLFFLVDVVLRLIADAD
jgi:hypothetical protein